MNFLDWITSWAVRQSLGTKRGAQLESNPVFQAAAAAVIPHPVHYRLRRPFGVRLSPDRLAEPANH